MSCLACKLVYRQIRRDVLPVGTRDHGLYGESESEIAVRWRVHAQACTHGCHG